LGLDGKIIYKNLEHFWCILRTCLQQNLETLRVILRTCLQQNLDSHFAQTMKDIKEKIEDLNDKTLDLENCL